MSKRRNNNRKKISAVNAAVILLAALGIFGAYCFIHFAYQATRTEYKGSQPETYTAASDER